MALKLFDDIQRTNKSGRDWSQHPYTYLNQSSRPEAGHIRDFLQRYFELYPTNHQHELIRRIQSRDIVQYKSAIFELLLHETLRRLGFTVTVHPTLSNSTKSPDFLVESSSGQKFYLEATLGQEASEQDSAIEQEKNKLFDYINTSLEEVNDFRLGVCIIKSANTSPPKKAIAKDIKNEIEKLSKQRAEDFTWRWGKTDGGWLIEFKVKKISGDAANIISYVYPYIAEKVSPEQAISKAVRRKAKKYGALPYPLIVAVNVDSPMLDKSSEMEGLFGKEQYVVNSKGDFELAERISTGKDRGAWIGAGEPENTRVTAVWIFHNLDVWELKNNHTLYVNPFSQSVLDLRGLESIPTARPSENKTGHMEWQNGDSIAKILCPERFD